MHYLTFKINQHFFAIDSQFIAFINQQVPITLLPMVPDYIDGVVNIEGEVLAQVCLATLFSLGEKKSDVELMVIDISGHRVVISVEAVLDRIEVNKRDVPASESKISERDKSINSDDRSHFEKEITVAGKNYLVINSMLFKDIVKPRLNDGEHVVNGFLTSEKSDNDSVDNESELSYLRFSIGGEYYLIPLLDVMEIIEVGEVHTLPTGRKEILGVSDLRDQPLLILDSHHVLSSNYSLSENSSQVFILSWRNKRVGFLVDEISNICTYSEIDIRQKVQEKSLLGAYIVDGNDINLLIDIDRLFAKDFFESIYSFMPNFQEEVQERTVVRKKLLQIFMYNQPFAIPLENVLRIVDKEHESSLSIVNSVLAGTVSIEGDILPLIDLTNYLQNSDEELSVKTTLETNKMVIIEQDEQTWAMNITAANNLLDVDVTSIENHRSHNPFISGIAKVDNILLSILDFSCLNQQSFLLDVSQ